MGFIGSLASRFAQNGGRDFPAKKNEVIVHRKSNQSVCIGQCYSSTANNKAQSRRHIVREGCRPASTRSLLSSIESGSGSRYLPSLSMNRRLFRAERS